MTDSATFEPHAGGRASLLYPLPTSVPAALVRDIRSDHAGETGAVRVYEGILAVSADARVRAFAMRHMVTEREHLELIDTCFPVRLRSRLLPLWRLAGWLTGALPALLGPRAVYATIDAVETFVDHHYQAQLDRIEAMLAEGDCEGADHATLRRWRDVIRYCHADELDHRDEARAAHGGASLPAWLAAWQWLIGRGSSVAVVFARSV